jgi:DUF971 family protein
VLEPTRIIEESDRELTIEWSNGSERTFTAAGLRKACPCATCVNEWTGEKILNDRTVSEDLTFAGISIVGRYALNFRFSDKHETGIYSFKYLSGLPQQA